MPPKMAMSPMTTNVILPTSSRRCTARQSSRILALLGLLFLSAWPAFAQLGAPAQYAGLRHGNRDCLFRSPTAQETCFDRSRLEAAQAFPFSDRVRFTVQNQHAIGTLVIGLLPAFGPAHVARFVTTTVIDPVQRRALWPRSHVAQERREIRPPLVAHDDPSASIVSESWVIRVVTAFLSRAPRDVFGRAETAMLRGTSDGRFTHATATSPRLSEYEMLGSDVHRLPTFTVTAPRRSTIPIVRRARLNGKFSEYLSRQIGECCHV